MLKIKLLCAVLLVVLLLSFCGPGRDVTYKEICHSTVISDKLIKMEIEKEVVLKTGDDIIGFIMAFQVLEDGKLLVADPIHARQCYLFDNNGKLLKKIGKHGEGPGEYLNLMAACVSKDRIFLIGNIRVNIFTKNGEFIKSNRRPFRGICNGAYAGPEGTIYLLSYNRYNEKNDTIYQLDCNGEIIQTFAPIENVPAVFDTFYPAAGLFVDELEIARFCNFKYQVNVYDHYGNNIKNVSFTSPYYRPPDFEKAKVRGHKEEKEYRSTFTQLDGFYKTSFGYISLLSNWKNVNESQNIYELWTKDFERIGYCEHKLTEDEFHLGVYNDRVIFASFEGETKIIFKKMSL